MRAERFAAGESNSQKSGKWIFLRPRVKKKFPPAFENKRNISPETSYRYIEKLPVLYLKF
jgi:hypothetical protein